MWLQKYISEKSIISIGTTSKVLGGIEDFQKILSENNEKDLYMRIGINSELSETQRLKRNKITDDDIVETNKILIDLDLRKDYQKKTGKILSDEEIIKMADELKAIIDTHDLFKTWSLIVASGNGVHIHYIGKFVAINKEDYSKKAQYFFNKFDEEILKKSDTLSAYKVDQANKNISRLVRIPGSTNQRTSFKELGPTEVKILYEQDIPFTFLENEIQYPVIESTKNMERLPSSNSEFVVRSEQESYIYRHMRQEFLEYVCKKTGLHLQSDGKNFGGGHNPDNKVFFMHDTVNKLITPEDSPHLKKSNDGFYTFVTLVQELEGIPSREDAADFIIKKFHVRKRLSKAVVFTGKEVVDFETKYSFTWGLDCIDNEVGRFHTGNLILLVGKTAVGKTEFTFNMAKQNALKGNKVVYVSMEMVPQQMIVRSARQIAGISKQDWTDKNITAKQKGDFMQYYSYIAGIENLKIASFEDHDIMKMCNDIIALSDLGYRLFFLDNLGFVTDGTNSNELEVFAKVSRELKKLTNKYPISIVLLHHLKKSEKKNENKPGSTSEIRGSQKLADDSDRVVQIWRNTNPDLYDEVEKKTVYFIQHKDREFGDICNVQFYFVNGTYCSKLQ